MRGHITRTFKITEATIAYFDTQSGQVVTLPEKSQGRSLGIQRKSSKKQQQNGLNMRENLSVLERQL